MVQRRVVGFQGFKEAHTLCCQLAAETAAKKAMENGLKMLMCILKGQGRREAALGHFKRRIKDTPQQGAQPIPHNGCSHPKEDRFKEEGIVKIYRTIMQVV
jgi:small subunit ribosomal protein S11